MRAPGGGTRLLGSPAAVGTHRKVEKAIAFKGRVSEIADDHSVQTFHRHYAHGTTLKVIAGSVVTAAQTRRLDKAVAGPVVLREEAEKSLGQPGSAAALGLSEEEVEQLRTGQLDMGVSSRRAPFASPYGRAAGSARSPPLAALNAATLALPSNLPQLLLFSDHLERLQLRLSPQLFHTLWRQSRVNIIEAGDGPISSASHQAKSGASGTVGRRSCGPVSTAPQAAHANTVISGAVRSTIVASGTEACPLPS